MNDHKYFGTDGIRGKVGCSCITPDFILKLGWSIGRVLSFNGSRRIIIGKDTRISGYMLESALGAGLSSAGFSTFFVGLMPSPAIAYLTRVFAADVGIVISASHNPYYDNGIKCFSAEGTKISNDLENKIEVVLNNNLICVDSSEFGTSSHIYDAAGRYMEFCKNSIPKTINFNGLKIVIDCAHGATYNIAPDIFSDLGANVVSIGCDPNGMNINEGCGTTNICHLRNKVVKESADLGIAYDGDGDRVIMVDGFGNKIGGDQIIYILAKEKLRNNTLVGGVVGTYMSNMGLEIAFNKLGIPFIRTEVGDRCVLESMQIKNWRIGGENSGHIILLDQTTTGDGILVGLQVLLSMISNDMSLYDMCHDIVLFPQALVNVHCIENKNPLELSSFKLFLRDIKKKLGKFGRVVIRKSGTEPCIRVMVEGDDINKISLLADQIACFITSVQ